MDTAFMDPVIVTLKGKDTESEVEFAVHEHRARTTVARAAAFLHAHEADVVAESVEQ